MADPDLRTAEEWFVDHGLPYFVDDLRDEVRARLGRSRIIGVTTIALVLAAAVGGLVGWLSRPEGEVSAGLTAGLTTVIVVWLLYAARALKVWMIARWAVNRAFASLELLFPLATRALPLLLLFVTFLFINTEVWMVASHLDGGILWGTVLLFAAVAVGFLVVRLIEELDRVDDEIGREELGDRADVVGLQKANLVLVLLINQALQVLLLALAVFVFFIVFGAVAMDEEVLEAWITPYTLTYPWGSGPISIELLQVSVFLAAFSGLYFAVYAINDENYRREFFTEVLGELEQALKMRVGYLLGRD